MNNRQAALIAATGLESTPEDAVSTARFLAAWLNEMDAAEIEGRLPLDPEVVRLAVEKGRDLEILASSPIVAVEGHGSTPLVRLLDGKTYRWFGSSWSRES
jgi:hypothetical protein